MTIQEVFNALDAYIYTQWTTTSIQAENYEFDTETTTPYIQPLFVPDVVAEGEVAGSNSTGMSIRYGTYMINVYRPKNEGLSTIMGYLSTLEGLFYYKDIKCVNTERPYSKRIGIEGNFVRWVVIIPWFSFVNE